MRDVPLGHHRDRPIERCVGGQARQRLARDLGGVHIGSLQRGPHQL